MLAAHDLQTAINDFTSPVKRTEIASHKEHIRDEKGFNDKWVHLSVDYQDRILELSQEVKGAIKCLTFFCWEMRDYALDADKARLHEDETRLGRPGGRSTDLIPTPKAIQDYPVIARMHHCGFAIVRRRAIENDKAVWSWDCLNCGPLAKGRDEHR